MAGWLLKLFTIATFKIHKPYNFPGHVFSSNMGLLKKIGIIQQNKYVNGNRVQRMSYTDSPTKLQQGI